MCSLGAASETAYDELHHSCDPSEDGILFESAPRRGYESYDLNGMNTRICSGVAGVPTLYRKHIYALQRVRRDGRRKRNPRARLRHH